MSAVLDAKKKYEEAMEKAKLQDSIERAMPKLEVDMRFHIYPLFGTVGSISTVNEVELHSLLYLLLKLPAVDNYHHKGSCSSFQIQDEGKYPSDVVTKISPYVIKVEKMVQYDQKSRVSWVTKVEDKYLRVEVRLKDNPFGKIDYVTHTDRVMCEKWVETRGLVSIPSELNPYEKIMWASGGREYINSFTLHFKEGAMNTDKFVTAITGVADGK